MAVMPFTSLDGSDITQDALRSLRNMKNPFEYGGVVSGNAFCNREKEVADLLRAMENNEKLFVFSERRYGKTSLVRTALGNPRQILRDYVHGERETLQMMANDITANVRLLIPDRAF
jgi:hypothetical protein